MKIDIFSRQLLVIFLIVIGVWFVSLLRQPSHWDLATIFYSPTTEERRIFNEKKGLDTSRIKVFYYNSFTIYLNRYSDNFFSLLDINGYFFGGHPREDIADKTFRIKIIWLFIFPFIVGLWKLRINWKWIVFLGILSILKNPDGWDLVLSIPISIIINNGFCNFKKIWIKLKN
jgi:hypothetical protein